VKHGARVTLGGKRHKLGGTFFEPTIIRDATPEMAFAKEEIFGPVVTLFRFKDDFVIVVRDSNGQSVVQMRSKSRDGQGDVGTNAKRVRAFLARVKE
jgi:acyl-CoA reductase-like NAD-dependent aldehyde dehydrogenase